MSRYKRIPLETKQEIIRKIKEEGITVSDLATQYSLHSNTIYGWLGSAAKQGDPILEINRLKKENEGLTALGSHSIPRSIAIFLNFGARRIPLRQRGTSIPNIDIPFGMRGR